MTIFEALRIVTRNIKTYVDAKSSSAHTKVTANFDGLGWESLGDGTYQQTLSFAGVAADSLILVKPANFYDTVWAQMGCRATAQGDGSVTFVCNDPQAQDVALTVEVIILQ